MSVSSRQRRKTSLLLTQLSAPRSCWIVSDSSGDGASADATHVTHGSLSVGSRIVLGASTSDTTGEELIRIVKSGLGREAIAAAAEEVQRQIGKAEEDSSSI
jgi:hypothetical protein